MDAGYEKILKIVGRKHDLIGIVLQDQREKFLFNIGLAKFYDAETGEVRYLDTSDKQIKKEFDAYSKMMKEKRKSLFISSRLDSIEIETSQSYIKPLVDFFKQREKRW